MTGATGYEAHVAGRSRIPGAEFEDVEVDAALAQLLRHHTATPDEFSAALAFTQEEFTTRQLDILVSSMGPRLRLRADDVYLERRNAGRRLRASIRFSLHVRWMRGVLLVARPLLPDTLATALTGRPLRSVLDHPYLPDVTVAAVSDHQEGWAIHPDWKERRRAGEE